MRSSLAHNPSTFAQPSPASHPSTTPQTSTTPQPSTVTELSPVNQSKLSSAVTQNSSAITQHPTSVKQLVTPTEHSRKPKKLLSQPFTGLAVLTTDNVAPSPACTADIIIRGRKDDRAIRSSLSRNPSAIVNSKSQTPAKPQRSLMGDLGWIDTVLKCAKHEQFNANKRKHPLTSTTKVAIPIMSAAVQRGDAMRTASTGGGVTSSPTIQPGSKRSTPRYILPAKNSAAAGVQDSTPVQPPTTSAQSSTADLQVSSNTQIQPSNSPTTAQNQMSNPVQPTTSSVNLRSRSVTRTVEKSSKLARLESNQPSTTPPPVPQPNVESAQKPSKLLSSDPVVTKPSNKTEATSETSARPRKLFRRTRVIDAVSGLMDLAKPPSKEPNVLSQVLDPISNTCPGLPNPTISKKQQNKLIDLTRLLCNEPSVASEVLDRISITTPSSKPEKLKNKSVLELDINSSSRESENSRGTISEVLTPIRRRQELWKPSHTIRRKGWKRRFS
eukprot:sb/3464105/